MIRPLPRPYPWIGGPEVGILSATAFILCRNPLTGAFAYEFSFFLGIMSGLLFAIAPMIRISRIERRRPFTSQEVRRALLSPTLTLLFPLAVCLLHRGLIPTCRFEVGLTWFVLLPWVSAYFGLGSAFAALGRPTSKGRGVLLALIPTLLFSLLTLRDLALDPPLFFLHPTFGYLAGPLYDEWIPLGLVPVTFRIWTLLLAVCLAAPGLVRWLGLPFRFAATTRIVGLLLLSCLFFRSPLGWFHSHAQIQTALGSKLEGPWVRLYFPSTRFSSERARSLHRALEYRVQDLSRRFGLPSDSPTPVHVYLYGSDRQKRELTGTRYTMIGNPMQRSLHLLWVAPGSTMLPHELTHVLAAPFGLPGVGITLRLGLLEGLATAMERYRDGLSIHEWAGSMLKLGLLPRIPRVMDPIGFWSESPTRAYLAAGSFTQWLIDTHGWAPFWSLYRGAAFEDAYDQNVASLESEWLLFLGRSPPDSEVIARAKDTLKAPSIFQRQCPHDVAEAVETGWRCIQENHYILASQYFRDAWNYSGRAPSEAIRRGRAESRGGNWTEVETIGRTLVQDTRSSPAQKAWGAMLWGDALLSHRRWVDAEQRYRSIETKGLDSGFRLTLEARLALLRHSEIPTLWSWIQNPAGSDWIQAAESLPNHPDFFAVRLLAAQASLDRMQPRLTERILEKLEGRKSETWERERLQLVAAMAEELRSVDRATGAYRQLYRLAKTDGERLQSQDQVVRLHQGR